MARCELLNDVAMDSVNRFFKSQVRVRSECCNQLRACWWSKYIVAPTLLLEFHDHDEATALRLLERARVICHTHHCTSFRQASQAAEREDLWRARKGAYFASLRSRTRAPGSKGRMTILVTDVCVPMSRMAECIVETEKDFKV